MDGWLTISLANYCRCGINCTLLSWVVAWKRRFPNNMDTFSMSPNRILRGLGDVDIPGDDVISISACVYLHLFASEEKKSM